MNLLRRPIKTVAAGVRRLTRFPLKKLEPLYVGRCTLLAAFVLAAGVLFTGNAQASDSSRETLRIFLADPQTLAASKSMLAAGDRNLRPALEHLLAEADRELSRRAPSVMDKRQMPPSGDKHDFMSQAPYYWPSTNSSDAKFVNHDGERNPEAAKGSDAGNFASVCYGSHTLALAYYFSGDEKYAAKASQLIRVWFLDPATRMNPNLNFGQGIPGGVDGRPAGLIGARGLAELVDAIGLLAGSKNWTTNDQQRMTVWAGDYLHWLTTSKIGLGEDAATNNHGTFYDVQAVSLALFLGKTDFAREKLLAAREKRIAKQIDPDGKMPRELTRTLSFHYSLFNLQAQMQLAALGSSAGVDLWHYQTGDGRCLLKAVEFLAPFADPARAWPYQQIQKPNRRELGELILLTAAQFPDSKIKDSLKFFRHEDYDDDAERLYLKMCRWPAATEVTQGASHL
jgi:Alginate lyase